MKLKIGKMLDPVAMTLSFVGGLNWGVIGLFGINLVSTLLSKIPVIGSLAIVGKAIYVLVGLSAIYLVAKALLK